MAKILVVDDSPASVLVIKSALSGPHVELLSAASAAEALMVIASQQPDMIFLDIGLPDRSGLESFRADPEVGPDRAR